MSILPTTIDTQSAEFQRNAEAMRRLLDEFEARHVRETVAQLVSRSSTIAERVAAGTVAVAGATYHLADGRAALCHHVGDIGE